MAGMGTLVNALAVLGGGALGLVLKKGLREGLQKTIMQALGVCVLFIGLSGTLEGMLSIKGQAATFSGSMMAVISLVVGALLGNVLRIEEGLEKISEALKNRFAKSGDTGFSEGFLTASVTICIGAMAVVGAINDGINQDPTMLYTKAILDGVLLLILASTFGVGTLFSVVPLVIIQGSITCLAKVIEPVLTASMLTNIAIVGNMLIFCIGINLLEIPGLKLKIAGMLPAIVVAILYAMFF